MKHNYSQLRVGLAGLGLAAYWSQFPGLEARLRGYVAEVAAAMKRDSRVVVNLGLIDSPGAGLDAGHRARREDIAILFVYVTTYALSASVLPLIRQAGVPVVLLNLQPGPAMDYARLNALDDRTAMTGEWLAYCSACPMPEVANILRRLEIPFHQVTGMLRDDAHCWNEIEQWLRAAEVMHSLAHSRIGLMGHYYSGMLDIATDLAQVSGRFGLQLEMLEVDALSALRHSVREDEIRDKLAVFRNSFEIGEDCDEHELAVAARTAVALDALVEQHGINLLAYYYKGTGVAENEETMRSIILGTSMLTGAGVPVAGEYEVKNCIAMKILSLLGTGGSFTEYYAMDFAKDIVLMGHDGPGHPAIAESKVRVRPLRVYHGKTGAGLSVEMSVKQGPVTLLSVVEDTRSGFMLLTAEGESVPGPTLAIGNTNSRYRFPLGARGFVESWNAHGPAHHCAIGTGHNSAQIGKLAALLRLPFVRIC